MILTYFYFQNNLQGWGLHPSLVTANGLRPTLPPFYTTVWHPTSPAKVPVYNFQKSSEDSRNNILAITAMKITTITEILVNISMAYNSRIQQYPIWQNHSPKLMKQRFCKRCSTPSPLLSVITILRASKSGAGKH